MFLDWDFSPPDFSEIEDKGVLLKGSHLAGKHIAVCVTGSIAAYRVPDLIRELRKEGADTTVFITKEGLNYVSRKALEWCSQKKIIESFSLEAEHLNDSNPFDAVLVAPASYNTINKVALGIADSVVTTSIAAALGRMERKGVPVLFAPAMHGLMHNNTLIKSLSILKEEGAIIIPPKQIDGKNKLAAIELIVAFTIRAINKPTLSDKSILITGGSTPVPLDSIRFITSCFTGALSIEIAREAWFKGAKVQLVLGKGSKAAPEFLKVKIVQNFNDYKKEVHSLLQKHSFDWGIFTAAAADFHPESVYDGKFSSQIDKLTLNLLPTKKLIEGVKKDFPYLKMVTFKYEENVSHDELIAIAKEKLSKKDGPQIIVVNRAEEFLPDGTQVAWLLDNFNETKKLIGKPFIATSLIDRIEKIDS